jgi:hypothetical protein
MPQDSVQVPEFYAPVLVGLLLVGVDVFFPGGTTRADEAMGATWSYLDITPLGRQETWEDSPEGYPQTPPYKWWNWHDNYDAEASPDPRWIDIITDPYEAARKREAEEKA